MVGKSNTFTCPTYPESNISIKNDDFTLKYLQIDTPDASIMKSVVLQTIDSSNNPS